MLEMPFITMRIATIEPRQWNRGIRHSSTVALYNLATCGLSTYLWPVLAEPLVLCVECKVKK